MASAMAMRVLRSMGVAQLSHHCSRLPVPMQLVTRQLTTARAAAAQDVEDFEDMDVQAPPAFVQRRVLKLKEIQKSYDTINRDYQAELAQLQSKYQEKYQPLFDQRLDVVLGKTPVDKYDVEDDGEADEGLKQFWLDAFMNHDKIGPYLTERDQEVLVHLIDVRSKVLTGEQRGFELTFKFEPNPFMKTTELTKTYVLEPEEDVIPKQFIGCSIEWADARSNPTVELKKKRVKGKKGGFTEETVPCESFFNIFDPPQIPDKPEDLEDEEMDSLQQELTADFEIGFAIKEQVIPRAVEWYTGELAEDMMDDYDAYDEGEDEEEMEDMPPPMPGPKAGKASRR